MSGCDRPLAGLRVLVAEDEFLVAALIADTLEAAGAEVLGPACSLAEGLRLAGEAAPGSADLCAVLDWNLDGQRSDPLARLLTQRGVPFVIATGYGSVPAEFAAAPVVAKPFDTEILVGLLGQLRRPAN